MRSLKSCVIGSPLASRRLALAAMLGLAGCAGGGSPLACSVLERCRADPGAAGPARGIRALQVDPAAGRPGRRRGRRARRLADHRGLDGRRGRRCGRRRARLRRRLLHRQRQPVLRQRAAGAEHARSTPPTRTSTRYEQRGRRRPRRWSRCTGRRSRDLNAAIRQPADHRRSNTAQQVGGDRGRHRGAAGPDQRKLGQRRADGQGHRRAARARAPTSAAWSAQRDALASRRDALQEQLDTLASAIGSIPDDGRARR